MQLDLGGTRDASPNFPEAGSTRADRRRKIKEILRPEAIANDPEIDKDEGHDNNRREAQKALEMINRACSWQRILYVEQGNATSAGVNTTSSSGDYNEFGAVVSIESSMSPGLPGF